MRKLKKLNRTSILLIAVLALCCSTDKVKNKQTIPDRQSTIDLSKLESFEETSINWQVVSEIALDSLQTGLAIIREGEGILINDKKPDTWGNLFTKFKHGDILLELDVMMPKGSNSGIYFQSRYEIQLFDSWNVQNPKHSDMGGIYQRWDETKAEAERGFEGHSPLVNAARAPGVWQHFKIKFLAPKFDRTGHKTQNAKFEKVWLNNILIHQNVELNGPTRASPHQDEVDFGPLMFQGDHGPVALKNITYKFLNIKDSIDNQ